MIPITTQRLCIPCDFTLVGTDPDNPNCFFGFILDDDSDGGPWESWFSQHWFGEPSIPKLDDTINAGYGYCFAWALGIYPTGFGPVVGDVPPVLGYTGNVAKCSPRGLEQFASFNARFPGFVQACKTRNIQLRNNGKRSSIYVGSLPLGLITRNMALKRRNQLLDMYLAPVIEARFNSLFCDASAVCSQKKGRDATMYLAERCLERGIEFGIEDVSPIHPDLFNWNDGRFAQIVSYGSPGLTGANYFGNGYETHVQKYLWLQGSVDQATRYAAAEAAAPKIPLLDFGDSTAWNPTP